MGALGSEAYRVLYENGSHGVLCAASDGRVLCANPAACAILGRTEAEIGAVGRQGLIDETDERWAPLLAQRVREGRVRGVARMIRGDGAAIEVEIDARIFTEASSGEERACTTLCDVTERVTVERELAATRARLDNSQSQIDALLEHAPMPISLHDLAGRSLLANQPAIDAGIEDIAGLTPTEINEPEMGASVDEAEQPVVEGKRAVTFEFTGPHRDGTDHNYQVTKYRITDADGNVISVGGISLDVTRHRRAEEAAARMAAIIDATAVGVIVKTIDGQILSWNPAAERVYGYTAADAIGRHISFLVPPGRDDEIPGILARLARDEDVVQFETVRRRADGVDIDVSLTLSPIHDVHGAVIGASTIVRDVTAERASRESTPTSEVFRSTVDDAPVGIVILEADGRAQHVNRMLCNLTGYAEDELLSKTLDGITHPDDLHTDRAQRRQLQTRELSSYEIEKRLLCADGTTMSVLLSASAVRDTAGALVRFVCQVQDITERKRQERALLHMAHHDTLTGLTNSGMFSEHTTHMLAEQARFGGELALLMLDLDRLKYVNDRFGHCVGDQVICAAADTLRGRMRESDVIGRLGGDEFAVLMPYTGRAGAELVAKDLVAAVAKLKTSASGRRLRVSASIGVVVTEQADKLDKQGLLDAADLAMYEAKAAGRGRYAVHDCKDGRRRASAPTNWSERIHRALRDDLFVLHYQPILKLDEDSSSRYEALIRLADQPGEIVEAGKFLDIAERYGLMTAIDRWVIPRVITALSSGELPEDATIALNISSPSLADPELLNFIEQLLANHEIDSHQLIFEIAEPAAFARLDDAKRVGRRLQQLGCELALDHFGSGFGSFMQLKHVPHGYIKIDGAFIRNLPKGKSNRVLVDAMVRVARGLGKQTVAEFVGDDQTVQILTELGVDYAQGYHIGRPGAAEHIAASAAARS